MDVSYKSTCIGTNGNVQTEENVFTFATQEEFFAFVAFMDEIHQKYQEKEAEIREMPAELQIAMGKAKTEFGDIANATFGNIGHIEREIYSVTIVFLNQNKKESTQIKLDIEKATMEEIVSWKNLMEDLGFYTDINQGVSTAN